MIAACVVSLTGSGAVVCPFPWEDSNGPALNDQQSRPFPSREAWHTPPLVRGSRVWGVGAGGLGCLQRVRDG